MNVLELISKWDFSHSWCARRIGMSPGLFHNKLKKHGNFYFKKEELDRLVSELRDLKKDITSLNRNRVS